MSIFVYLLDINNVEMPNHLERELTPIGRLVDHLPYSYEWIDGVHD